MRRSALAFVFAALAVAACTRELSVPAPHPLVVTPGAARVAPRERLVFEASGGASGYRYAFAGAPGSGGEATLDAATGAYRAGATGPATDVIQVTDAGGSSVTATVTVGAQLTISPQIALTAPGGKVTFVADGGLPPYTFGFQAKGNRSGGRVDAVTGEYTAGPNTGTQDKVGVLDAAGAFALPQLPVYVGALHLPLPGGAAELELGDLNGDGRRDVISMEPVPSSGSVRRLTTQMLLPGGALVSETYFLTGSGSISAFDLGDGQADVFVGSLNGGAASFWRPDATGHLAKFTTWNTAYVPRLPYAAVYSGLTGCTPASGMYRLNWNATSGSFDPATCMTGISSGQQPFVGDIAAGSFDAGASGTTIAWLERDNYVPTMSSTPQLHFLTATPRLLGMPAAGWSAVLPNGAMRQQLVAGAFRGGAATDVAVLLVDPGGRTLLEVAPGFTTASAPAWVSGALDPFPGGPAALGIVRCPAVGGSAQDTLAAWNGTLRPELVAVDASGVATVSSAYLPAVHVPVTVAACGDVNGDGVPDLVLASDSTSTMALVWGDGDGGFGRRPHFQATGAFAVAQLDGDGVGDVVVGTEAPSLVALLGDEHQLARVAETPLAFAPAGIWAGDLGGAAVTGWSGDLVLADSASNLWLALGSRSGVYQKPVQIVDAPVASGRVPRIVAVAFAKLGGTGRQDLAVLYETAPNTSTPGGPVPGRYELDAVIMAPSGAPKVIPYTFASFGPALQPVDLDGDGRDELVIADGLLQKTGPSGWRPLRMHVDPAGAGTIALIGTAPAYGDPGILTRFTAAGRSGDVAVFLSLNRAALVWGAGADPSTVLTTLPGGLATPFPRTVGNVTFRQAVLGDVGAASGAPALVFAYSGTLYAVEGLVTAGRLSGFGASVVARAPGAFAGFLPQGATAPPDLLVFTGEELIPLVWQSGGFR